MADEIQVQNMLQIINGNQQYLNRPTAFTADMTGIVGPTPGSVNVSKYGTNVDLSQIVYPGGMCELTNVSPTVEEGDVETYVEYGIYDQDLTVPTFRPLGEIFPGESYVIRLSRQIGQEVGTGSGTTIMDTGLRLRLKAVGAAQVVKVNAFDK